MIGTKNFKGNWFQYSSVVPMADERIRINEIEKNVLKKVLRIQLGKIQDHLTDKEQRVAQAFLERLAMRHRTRWKIKNLLD